MRQPRDCDGLVILPTPEPPSVAPYVPAGWFVLFMFIAVAVFEVWALKTRHRTISQMVQKLSKGRRWFRWLAVSAMAVLGWHIFWGFPW